MRSPVRGLSGCACIVALFLYSAGASAQKEQLPQWYVGPLVGYVVPDSVRDAKFGLNLHVIGGYTIIDGLAAELNGFGQQTTRSSDNRYDYSYGGGIDLALGTPQPGNPIFLLGAGMVYEDLIQGTFTSPYANLAVGYYLPFSFGTELWRLEARYNPIFNRDAFPNTTVLEDVRINIGMMFGFGHPAESYDEAPPAGESPAPVYPEAAPPPAPLADEDGDGVPDASDKCPGTPRWVRVDAFGCAPDDDADGIDNTKDCCPSTPAGSTVDGQGCEPTAAPPPSPALLPSAGAASAPRPAVIPGDEDGDGVPDDADLCPHTAPGLTVESNGCLVVETVILTKVHFEFDSDVLTDAAFRILNSVAASLRQKPGSKLVISGHTDEIGSAQYNMGLSKRRAEVVREFVGYLGIDAERMTIKAYGESKPTASNSTEQGRAENRRVEFKMDIP